MKFKGLDKALKVIQDKVNDTLLHEVAGTIKEVEREHIYNDVYTRPPGQYLRRYDDGGLGDVNNMYEYLEGDGVLGIAQGTPFNPYINGYSPPLSQNVDLESGLDGLVNYGNGWNGIFYDVKAWGPTNFIENTIDDLRSSGKHVEALKNGLKKRGLNVK